MPHSPIPDRAISDPSILSSPMTSDEFLEMKAKVKVLEAQMVENTALTKKSLDVSEQSLKISKEVKDSTNELVELGRKVSGTIDLFNMVGKVLKPIAWLGIAAATMYGMAGVVKMWVITALGKGI